MKWNFLIVSAALALWAGQDLAQASTDMHPMILNGADLQPEELPQMAMLTAMGWKCSATLVGPKVIITAGHCVSSPHGAQTRQTFGPVLGKYYAVTLEHHPKYTGTDDNLPLDMAVKYDMSIGTLDDAPPIAPVSVVDETPALQSTVLYAGIGRPRVGVRQYGYANVVTMSDIGMTIRGFGQNPQIGAPGDSGGPSFVKKSDGGFYVVGVASTSTLEKDETKESGWPEALPYTEGVARVFMDNFIREYAQKNNVEICGVNKTCAPVLFK